MRSIEILMIEDNLGDIELTRHALSSGHLNNRLNVVEDGEKALDYLYQRGDYIDAVRPDLILLDLNLPKISGREVLEDIKFNKMLSIIPVVVLSSSEDAKDVQSMYELNANSFVTKPVLIDDFIRVTQAIESFWVEVSKLPTRNG